MIQDTVHDIYDAVVQEVERRRQRDWLELLLAESDRLLGELEQLNLNDRTCIGPRLSNEVYALCVAVDLSDRHRRSRIERALDDVFMVQELIFRYRHVLRHEAPICDD